MYPWRLLRSTPHGHEAAIGARLALQLEAEEDCYRMVVSESARIRDETAPNVWSWNTVLIKR